MQIGDRKPMTLQKPVPANYSGRLRKTESGSNWVLWITPSSYWDVVGAHLLPALISGFPLMLSLWIPLKLVPMLPCSFLRLTNYPCPFCGFTRSFWAISNGEWAFALNNYPLVGLLYLIVVLVFIWNMAGLISGKILIRGRALRMNPNRMRLLLVSGIILFMLNWVYRLSAGLH
jgi:hypothetical protein